MVFSFQSLPKRIPIKYRGMFEKSNHLRPIYLVLYIVGHECIISRVGCQVLNGWKCHINNMIFLATQVYPSKYNKTRVNQSSLPTSSLSLPPRNSLLSPFPSYLMPSFGALVYKLQYVGPTLRAHVKKKK